MSKTALVLCTGNSCRSIMAEALINHLCKGAVHAVSAGSHPAGFVHPQSLATLGRHAVAVDTPRSKSWDEFANQQFDFVITVCDEAAREPCPAFGGAARRLHWSTADPAKLTGSADEIQAAFDSAFDSLKQRIEEEFL